MGSCDSPTRSREQHEVNPVCGNDACENGESTSCPSDCSPATMCGNGVCDPGETSACADCSNNAPVCGDGVCAPSETSACSDCAVSADTGTVAVVNNSSYTVWYLYVTPCSSSSWGPDLLGENVISPGQLVSDSEVPPGCYDFRAETQGASTYWEEYGAIVTAGETYTWTLGN